MVGNIAKSVTVLTWQRSCQWSMAPHFTNQRNHYHYFTMKTMVMRMMVMVLIMNLELLINWVNIFSLLSHKGILWSQTPVPDLCKRHRYMFSDCDDFERFLGWWDCGWCWRKRSHLMGGTMAPCEGELERRNFIWSHLNSVYSNTPTSIKPIIR